MVDADDEDCAPKTTLVVEICDNGVDDDGDEMADADDEDCAPKTTLVLKYVITV